MNGATQVEETGLFFTSIPKAGKNLVYSFLHALGVDRSPIDRIGAVRAVERPWLLKARAAQTYALPPEQDGSNNLNSVLTDFCGGLGGLRRGEVLHHHFPTSPTLFAALQERNISTVLVYRDPRDILLSMADYILVQEKPVHLAKRFQGLTRDEIISRLWKGDDSLISFSAYMEAFVGWRMRPGTLTLRFEDLIGTEGGGESECQIRALQALRNMCPATSEARFEQAVRSTFNPNAGTFFRGRRERWRLECEPSVTAILRSQSMLRVREQWGYAA